MRRTDDTIYPDQHDAAGAVVAAVRREFPRVTQEQAETIVWLRALIDARFHCTGRRINVTCVDCQCIGEWRYPGAAIDFIVEHHGHRTVVGITNPPSTPTDVADERKDLPVGDAVVSITSGRGEK